MIILWKKIHSEISNLAASRSILRSSFCLATPEQTTSSHSLAMLSGWWLLPFFITGAALWVVFGIVVIKWIF